jgi:hypothetical protein
MHKHHAPVAQPNGAAVGLKAQQATQIAVRGVFEVFGHGISWKGLAAIFSIFWQQALMIVPIREFKMNLII